MTLFAAAASGRPRYLMVDLDDVEFVGEQERLPIVPMSAMMPQRRYARDIDDQDVESSNSPFNRPQALPVIQSRQESLSYKEVPQGIP